MSIIETLKNKGIEIVTNGMFIGYERTDAGLNVTRNAEKVEKKVDYLKPSTGRFVFPCNDDIVYITTGTEYEGKVKSKEETRKLAEQGLIYSFKSSDLYAEYYNFAEEKELECFFRHGYSTKTRKYIEKVMDEIGLTRYTDDQNGSSTPEGTPETFDVIESVHVACNATTEIGKLNDQWFAQTCYSVDLDDFGVIKMYFSKKPTAKSIRKALAVRDFEHRFEHTEVFTCWECGHLTHWTDTHGDITEKLTHLEDKYCGC